MVINLPSQKDKYINKYGWHPGVNCQRVWWYETQNDENYTQQSKDNVTYLSSLSFPNSF